MAVIILNHEAYGNQREAVQLAYMAGIFDGEGTFSITKTQPKGYTNPRYSGRVMIGMVEREVIELFANRYGGSVLVERVPGRKLVFRWKKVGDSENTAIVVKELLPFLIAKRKQAELLLEYIISKKSTGFQRNQGVPLSELQRREDFYLRMKELNAVGAPATTNRDDIREDEVIV